jgi:hypothetical protein
MGARQPTVGDFIGFAAGDVFTSEDDPPLFWCVNAVDDIEERGLARSIRPDQAEDLPFRQIKRDASEGLQAAKSFRDAPLLRAGCSYQYPPQFREFLL